MLTRENVLKAAFIVGGGVALVRVLGSARKPASPPDWTRADASLDELAGGLLALKESEVDSLARQAYTAVVEMGAPLERLSQVLHGVVDQAAHGEEHFLIYFRRALAQLSAGVSGETMLDLSSAVPSTDMKSREELELELAGCIPADDGEVLLFELVAQSLGSAEGVTGEQLYAAFYQAAGCVTAHIRELIIVRLEHFPRWATAICDNDAVLGVAVRCWAEDRSLN